jgi:anti-anti-sigma regulatory factor
MSATVGQYTSTVGYVIECRGATVSTQMRNVALVIAVAGRLDRTNTGLVGESMRRFTALGSPLVADLSAVDVGDDGACDRLLEAFGAECARRGIGWVLVAPSGTIPSDEAEVVRADSVVQALQHFVLAIRARRTTSLAPGRGVRSSAGAAVRLNWTGDGAQC